MSNNIDNWNLTDDNQGKPLDAIDQLSSRAWSLLVRNRTKPLLKFSFINVTGAIEMLEGLEVVAKLLGRPNMSRQYI